MTRASALRGGGGASTRAAGARRSGAGGALVAPDQLVDGGEQGPPLGVDGVVDLLVVGRRVEDDVAGVGQRHDLGAPLRVLLPGAPLRLAEPLELDDDRRHRGRPAGAPRRASRDRRAPQTPRLGGPAEDILILYSMEVNGSNGSMAVIPSNSRGMGISLVISPVERSVSVPVAITDSRARVVSSSHI